MPEDSPLQKYTSLAEFKGKIFGTVTGYEYNDEINKEKKNWKIDEAPIAAQNMKKLSAKRIDFTIDDPAWARIEMKKHNLKFRILSPEIAAEKCYVVMSPKHTAFVKKLDEKLVELKKNGFFDQTYKKHIGLSYEEFKKSNGIKD